MSTFKFVVGKSYKTQAGNFVKVLARACLDMPGYECLICDDDRHRYDRSTHSDDAGRVTGTDHDYSCEHNFERKELGQ